MKAIKVEKTRADDHEVIDGATETEEPTELAIPLDLKGSSTIEEHIR